MNTRKYITLTLALASVSFLQAKEIGGKVTDAATGNPIAGVQVKAYGDERFTAMTNAEGIYLMKDVPEYVNSLYMTLEGCSPQQIAIGNDAMHVDAQLYRDAFSSSYKAYTSGNRTSGTTGFGNSVEMSIDPFIQGRMNADIHAVSRGGNDGLGNVMFINGINSLNSNAQPLIVIDGMIVDVNYDGSMLHDGYFNNLLANINVNDIESVEVMKNGTAIYGAKGANGVLLIKTKRNKSMTTKIDLTIGGKFISQPRTPSMMEAEDYRTYVTEMLAPRVSDMSTMKFMVADPKYYYYPQYHNETDWKKEVYRNSFAQSYGINVQGGDDVASYNLSVGYSAANSTLKGNDFSRFDMRLNTDIEIIRNLNVRFDASFSDVKRDLRDVGVSNDVESTTITSPNFLAMVKSPFLSPYAYDVNGNLSGYLAEADDYLQGYIITSDRSLANPVSILDNGDGRNKNTFGNRLVTFTVAPSYKINKYFTVSEDFGFTLVNTNENYYLPITGVPQFRVPGLTDIVYVENAVSSLATRQNSIQSDTRLTWTNRYGANYIKAFAGFRFMNNRNKVNIQNGYNTGNDKTPNMSPSLQYKTTTGADDKYSDISWYAAADYNYAEKYYASVSLTGHASSRFGEDASALKMFGTRWGLFPSFQGSWVMSNEKWFSNVKMVDYLRLNLGFEITGNDNIDYKASRSYFVSRSMMGATLTGLVLENVGNSTLKWETTRKFNAGFETNLLNNRLHVGFNYFASWTSDLLMLQQMAWTTGLAQNWTNDGKLRNSGFDFSADVKVINDKDWKWELGATMGHYKNKLTDLGNGSDRLLTSAYGATIISEVGGPVGQFYGYKTNGVYSTEAEAQADGKYYLDQSGNKVAFQAGDMRFQDTNGDGKIGEEDRVVIGDPNPDIYGNFRSHLKWKRFALDMAFTYSIGNDIYNYQRSILESGKYFYNQTKAMNSRWTTEGQVTDIPRLSYQDPHGNSRFSDRWIEDGSYLKLSNITLSYAIPINRTFLQGITVWGAVNNVFTITKYLGSDPDCTASGNALLQGIDRGLLGQSRSFAMGVKVNL
ncbi:MAG: SusC/RagA family TonB-linked outer membrane protein [Prevotella sp.]|nr:SusC/RagA family TonB-linked outer membrane protein [Prevotella sp.]